MPKTWPHKHLYSTEAKTQTPYPTWEEMVKVGETVSVSR